MVEIVRFVLKAPGFMETETKTNLYLALLYQQSQAQEID